jgi:hypothetical protein
MSAVAESVARGAALLDDQLPGWAERIDPEQLQIASCYRCVLGQLFSRHPYPTRHAISPYGLGVEALGIGAGEMPPSWYGFDGSDADALNAEWRRVITERTARAPAGAAA